MRRDWLKIQECAAINQFSDNFVVSRELFQQENIDKDKETGQSRSNASLSTVLGGTEKLISDLKSDAKVS
jgi:hypothetical protein